MGGKSQRTIGLTRAKAVIELKVITRNLMHLAQLHKRDAIPVVKRSRLAPIKDDQTCRMDGFSTSRAPRWDFTRMLGSFEVPFGEGTVWHLKKLLR